MVFVVLFFHHEASTKADNATNTHEGKQVTTSECTFGPVEFVSNHAVEARLASSVSLEAALGRLNEGLGEPSCSCEHICY